MPCVIVTAQGGFEASSISSEKLMKADYKEPVLFICPDRSSGFGIVSSVIMATTESSLYNAAFVKAHQWDAGERELDVTAS